MVKTHPPGIVLGYRAAKAHTAEHRELAAPLDQQAHELQEIFVPAYGDAVLGNSAEPGHHASIERLGEFRDVAYRAERHALTAHIDTGQFRRQRLDFQAVDADYRVAVIHQVVGEGEARWPQPDYQHLAPAVGLRVGMAQVERIPAGQ